MKAMILAAGRGVRFRPVTDTLPKPLIAVGGEVLIERHLRRLAAAGVRQFVINLGWLGEQIERALGDGSRFGVEIDYSREGWPALETGGGVFRALPLLGPEPFLVVSGDIWSEYPVAQLVERGRQLAANDLAHLVLVPKDGYHPDFCLDRDRVRNAPPEYTFGNYSILRPELFQGCKDGAFPIGPMWHAAADEDRISGELYTGVWWNLGTPQQVQELEAQLATQRRTA
jgi:N-acetyl-alpha-D-muramate 1-phosphate uridylyltransferase